MPSVKLKIRVQTPQSYFLWNVVEPPAEKIRNGSVVEVMDSEGNWIAHALYNGHARVRLRCLTQDPNEAIDEAFFSRRIVSAFELRESLGIPGDTDAYRLVHAEGDGLSGLVIDRYADLFVVEYFSSGMFRFRKEIEGAVLEKVPEARFYRYAEKRIQKQESFDLFEEVLPTPAVISEHGLRFKVQPGVGFKTGFFLDQRDNRKRLAPLCRNKRVLDLCCHSGAFSVYAKARGKALSVRGIDLSNEAIDLARENASLNGCEIELLNANLYDYLPELSAQKAAFDIVILDPSKQTRSEKGRSQALHRYFLMNQLALRVVASGGFFLTCSCSGWVDENAFLEILREAAQAARRSLQVFEISGAAPDHPFLLTAIHSRYLKAVWVRVE